MGLAIQDAQYAEATVIVGIPVLAAESASALFVIAAPQGLTPHLLYLGVHTGHS